MRSQLHDLELVYPPISNQEAEWVKKDKKVLKELSKSNLYFIGQKPETFFSFDESSVMEKIEEEQRIYFKYHSGTLESSGYIDLQVLLKRDNIATINLEIELGEKLIRIWNCENSEVLEWFTTDKILYDKNRKMPAIIGFEDFAKFYVYNLHYVGISKKGSSFSRLVIKPHDKRLRILSNEHPLNIGSRVTDEIVHFFFRIKSVEIKMFLEEKDFDEIGKNELDNYLAIIADAEKAFVKILNAKYNEVKFENYPISRDGLYPTSIEKHTFSIDEDVTFITDTNTIRGARKRMDSLRQGDFIAISKDNVELIKVDKEYLE